MATNWTRLARQARGISASAKATLFALAVYADPKGRSFPKQATLAADTGFVDRTVRRALVELEQAGLIVREHRQRLDGSRTSDLITLQDLAGQAAALAATRRLPLVALMQGGAPAVSKPVEQQGVNLGITETQPDTESAWPTGHRVQATK